MGTPGRTRTCDQSLRSCPSPSAVLEPTMPGTSGRPTERFIHDYLVTESQRRTRRDPELNSAARTRPGVPHAPHGGPSGLTDRRSVELLAQPTSVQAQRPAPTASRLPAHRGTSRYLDVHPRHSARYRAVPERGCRLAGQRQIHRRRRRSRTALGQSCGNRREFQQLAGLGRGNRRYCQPGGRASTRTPKTAIGPVRRASRLAEAASSHG
jgi:hypothetical protein